MNNKGQLKKIGIIATVVLILVTMFVIADISIVDIFPTTNISTHSTTMNVTKNFTVDDMNKLVYKWNNSEYNLYDYTLVGFWQFNNNSLLSESNDLIRDLSIYENNGTSHNGSGYIVGHSENAFNYTNTLNTSILVTNSVSLNFSNDINFTIAFWIKASPINMRFPSSGTQYILTKNDGLRYPFEIRQWATNSSDIVLTVYNGSKGDGIQAGTILTDSWRHVVFKKEGSKYYYIYNGGVYVSGATTMTFDTGYTHNTQNIYIGNSRFESNNLNGTIDDLMMWNRSLSNAEINKLYNSQLIKYNETTWGFTTNETLGSILRNLNNNTLCITNFTPVETCSNLMSMDFLESDKPTIVNYNANNINLTNNTYYYNYNITFPNGDYGFGLDTFLFNFGKKGSAINYSIYNDYLVGWWAMDNKSEFGENITKIVDLSKYGNNLDVIGVNVTNYELSNSTWHSNGKFQGTYNFTNGGYASNGATTFQFDKTDSFAISFWYKLSNYNARGIFGIGNGTHFIDLYYPGATCNCTMLYYTNESNLNQYLQVGTMTGTVLNTWHNFVLVYNGTAFLGYSDGKVQPIYSAVMKPLAAGYQNKIYIGTMLAGQAFNGSIDDFKVWNRSLSELEAINMYNQSVIKYNLTNYGFSGQIDLNYSSSFLNSTNRNLNYTYGICVNNTLGNITCSNYYDFRQVLLNKTIQSNFSTKIGNINRDFYGMNDEYFSLANGTYQWMDTNCDGIKETDNNVTLHRQLWADAGMDSYVRVWWYDMNLFSLSEGVYNESRIKIMMDDAEYVNSRGGRIMWVVSYGTPTWLANTTSGYCNYTGGDYYWNSCSMLNNTKFAMIVEHVLNNFTQVIPQDKIDVVLKNEPYGGSWLNNLSNTDPRKATELIQLYNDSYDYLKPKFPNVSFGAPSGYFYNGGLPITEAMISNLTTKIEFINMHPYSSSSYITENLMAWYSNYLNGLCTTYGANCSRIIFDELNIYYGYQLSDDRYAVEYAYLYQEALNLNPSNISMLNFKWNEPESYTTCTSRWNEYPLRYTFFNQVDNVLYPEYYVMTNFSKLCKAGGGVYRSLDADNSTISCENNGQYSIITSNYKSESKEMIINLSLNNGTVYYPYNNITNFQTGKLYTVTSGIVNLGTDDVLDTNKLLYLSSGINPIISSISPVNLSTTYSGNFSARLFDDVGLDNSTLYILNKSGNLLITRFIDYVSGEDNIIQSWIVDLAVGVYNWWIELWDEENKQTISGNYTLTIDTTTPTIDFVSPTTTSTNHSQSNIYLNVSTSDTNNQSIISNIGLKLWLRFNNQTGENNTYALDYSGYGNNATGYNGTTSDISGKLGNCMKFDGVNDIFISTNDTSLNITDAITLSAWIKLDSYKNYSRIIAKSPSSDTYPYSVYGLLLDNNINGTRVRFELGSGNYQHLVYSTTNLSNDIWYLVTGVWNGSDNSAKIYINGVLDNSTLIKYFANNTFHSVPNLLTGKIDTNGNNVSIGDAGYMTRPFNGSIDDVLIYNRALSSNETLALYNGTRLDHDITRLSDGNYNATAYVQDLAGNLNSTSRWITLDTTYPVFTTIPANSSLWYFNETLNVNFDATDTNFDYYFINDTTNLSITQTGVLTNTTPMAVGNYAINVTINDSANNINWTIYTIQINKSEESCGVYFNTTSPITYPATFIAYTNCSTAYTLTQNGTTISNGTTIDRGASAYNISVQRTDIQNYTNTFNQEQFIINKETCQVLINNTSPITYPDTFKVWTNCTSNSTLYRNGTIILNNSEQALTIGTYNFSMSLNDTANYTETYNDTMIIVNDSLANAITYNLIGYETAGETYTLNITNTTEVTNAYINFNGTNYSSTITNLAGYTLLSNTIQINTSSIGLNTFYYYWNTSNISQNNSGVYSQTISPIEFGLCNATLLVPYFNLTFRDESTNNWLNASIPSSTWVYYLGDGTFKKTTSYISTGEFSNYSFCALPGDRVYHVDTTIQYRSGTDYPARIWNPDVTTYTGTAPTNTTLYLLSTSYGIVVTFQIVNTADQPLSGVEVLATREVNGISETIAGGTTSTTGIVTFWLNPSFVHIITFAKSGYTTATFNEQPTQSSYTITLTSTSTSTGGTTPDHTRGVKIYTYPTINELVNNTDYTFAFNMTSSYWEIDEFGFNLRLANGTIVKTASSTTEGTAANAVYNTNNQTIIYMDYYWNVASNHSNGTKYWVVSNTLNTDWSIKTFFDDTKTYLDSGLFGIDNFGRYLIAFLLLFLIVGVMGYKFGMTSPVFISVLTFSVVFFLDVITGLIPAVRGINHLVTYLAGLIMVLVIIGEGTR